MPAPPIFVSLQDKWIMAGETNLSALLKSMKPELHAGEYVFCTLTDGQGFNLDDVVGSFHEKEGLTVIVERSAADKLALKYSFVAAWITLTVHSSLEAVGLTAAFSKVLGDAGISCNVVAANFHDHIFVPLKEKERAMTVLAGLSVEEVK